MSYTEEMDAMLYNPLGMFSRKICEIYWASYQQVELKKDLENLYLHFA